MENGCGIIKYKNFFIIIGKFENVAFTDFQYDLVYSASAFHWVEENIGYSKVYAMLKSGGAFVRFANHPYHDKGNPLLSAEIEKLYSAYYYQYYDKDIKPENERTRTFSAKEYVELLGTYSDHIAIEERD